MAKITRKAFTRKKIIIGLSVFAAVTIVAVGVSVLALSQPTYIDNESSLNVGTVSSSGSNFVNGDTKIYVTGDETKSLPAIYRFEPEKDDNEGRVRFIDQSEVLSLTVEAVIDHSERLSFVSALTKCRDSNNIIRIQTAVSKGYIELPESFTFSETELNIYNAGDDVVLSDYFHVLKNETTSVGARLTFAYDIAFKWGSFFNHKNPGRYFDEDNLELPTGDANSPAGQDTVSGVLKDLKNLLNGIELDLWLTAK